MIDLQKGRAYVFIDEVQRLENPGLFLKYIYDLKRNLKLIVTGYINLIKLLAQQIGNLVNVSELANTLGLHKTTVDKYLQILEGTFVFKRLSPFFQSVRSELSKIF
jgi:hypothetical protein